MKLHLTILLLAALLMASCEGQGNKPTSEATQQESAAVTQLRKAAEEIDASCPVKTDEGPVLEGVVYMDQKWTYVYLVDADSAAHFTDEALRANVEKELYATTRQQIMSNEKMLPMLSALISAQSNLCYSYIEPKSGKSIDVQFAYAELRAMYDVMLQGKNKNSAVQPVDTASRTVQ